MINKLKEEALEEQQEKQRKINLSKEQMQKKIGVCHSSCTSVTNYSTNSSRLSLAANHNLH
jgi:hypothetical protein